MMDHHHIMLIHQVVVQKYQLVIESKENQQHGLIDICFLIFCCCKFVEINVVDKKILNCVNVSVNVFFFVYFLPLINSTMVVYF